MKSITIPININLQLYKAKNKHLVQLKNDKTSLWFLIQDYNISINKRIITAKSNTIRTIKKYINAIEIGQKRTLHLLGVGYKPFLIEEDGKRYLDIKISSIKPPRFLIPNDISITIKKNKVECWSYHPTLIDHFFKKIINKINFVKWT